MSKVVKGVGRAIKKVFKGVRKAVSSVFKGVKSVFKSKFGRMILMAAMVYFGGAALMGAMGGASAGTGFLGTLSGAGQGALAGISNAWTGLTGAATALTSGQGLAAAGNSIGGGFTGAYAAGGSAVTGAVGAAGTAGAASGAAGAAGAATTPTAAGAAGAADAAFTGATSTGLQTVAGDAANVLGTKAGSSLFSGMSPLAQYGVISGGAQLAGGLIQGVGANMAQKDQMEYERRQAEEARRRYNENVGTIWWGEGSGGAQPTGDAPPAGLVAGAMTPQQRYADYMRQQLQGYSPYNLPTFRA